MCSMAVPAGNPSTPPPSPTPDLCSPCYKGSTPSLCLRVALQWRYARLGIKSLSFHSASSCVFFLFFFLCSIVRAAHITSIPKPRKTLILVPDRDALLLRRWRWCARRRPPRTRRGLKKRFDFMVVFLIIYSCSLFSPNLSCSHFFFLSSAFSLLSLSPVPFLLILPWQASSQQLKFTTSDSCDRIKDEFQFLQAQYHRYAHLHTHTHQHGGSRRDAGLPSAAVYCSAERNSGRCRFMNFLFNALFSC